MNGVIASRAVFATRTRRLFFDCSNFSERVDAEEKRMQFNGVGGKI